MKSQENCGVCGQPLVYGTSEVSRRCAFCGRKFSALIYCPADHYVCDSCHQQSALEVIRSVLNKTTSVYPADILEKVMSHPAVPMHGPEHHAMVPAIILTAIKNSGYPVPEGALEKAIERGSKVPGGWCGHYGACGAGIGVGIAVSVLTGATPLTGESRGLAIEATSFTLGRIADGGPRCCKRASRKALEAASDFFKMRMGISLKKAHQNNTCLYVSRNKECIRGACPYFGESSSRDATSPVEDA
ncbi:MAG: hypothetical protein A2Z29_09155 [Chloroflexi bacterium RBG_16_56_11]|nr:MAG: hypothetical protein A2Z29_09155 [Chloroflexi bacterium RBG_16_56_11]